MYRIAVAEGRDSIRGNRRESRLMVLGYHRCFSTMASAKEIRSLAHPYDTIMSLLLRLQTPTIPITNRRAPPIRDYQSVPFIFSTIRRYRVINVPPKKHGPLPAMRYSRGTPLASGLDYDYVSARKSPGVLRAFGAFDR